MKDYVKPTKRDFDPSLCILHNRTIYLPRSSRPSVFCKKCVLKNFAKFTGKHLYQSHHFNKLCFPANFAKFLRTPFLTEHLWWLLLLLLAVICCHKLSLVLPLGVIRCHSLSFVVTHCHSISLDVSPACLFINNLYFIFFYFLHHL